MAEIPVEEAVEILSQKFILRPGISGVSISRNSDRLIIYVETREDAERIPPRILGHPVTVRVIGRITPLTEIPRTGGFGKTLTGLRGDKTARWRPAPGGVSIGHHLITAGTLATVVEDRGSGNPLILSNMHVLAPQWLKPRRGDPIIQPGRFDGGTVERDKIGELERWIEIASPPETNLVDAAVATPTDPKIVSREILDIGIATGPSRSVEEGDEVVKSGRTSCLTRGIVIDASAVVKVHYGGFGEKIFRDQILTTAMARPGDSGSLLVDPVTRRVVGLVFAGSSIVTVSSKASHVENLLDVRFPVASIDSLVGITAVSLIPVMAVAGMIVFEEINYPRQ